MFLIQWEHTQLRLSATLSNLAADVVWIVRVSVRVCFLEPSSVLGIKWITSLRLFCKNIRLICCHIKAFKRRNGNLIYCISTACFSVRQFLEIKGFCGNFRNGNFQQ